MRVENPPGYSPRFVELLPNRVSAQSIRISLAQGNGTISEALDLIERAIYVQGMSSLIYSDDGVSVDEKKRRWEKELEAFRSLAQELKENPPAFMEVSPKAEPFLSSMASAAPPSRLVWKGTKADLGRTYRILGPLLGCTGAEWERHFMGSGGESMDGAVENAGRDSSMGRTNEIPALRTAVKGMKPEAD